MNTVTITPRWQSDIYTADIEPKKSIRLYGTFKNLCNGPRQYDITFRIGDRAEYDSYNLKYVGTITGIGAKTVTITEKFWGNSTPQVHRLDLDHFASRNWDFDIVKIDEWNREERQYI